MTLREPSSFADLAVVRLLFEEYQTGIGVDLCFQGFNEELATLPGGYGRPRGRLWLAMAGGEAAGCVGIRPFGKEDDPGKSHPSGRSTPSGVPPLRVFRSGSQRLEAAPAGDCEMKRLYVRPAHRKKGIGRGLAVTAVDAAKELGYQRMYLDTLSSMIEATSLYRALGFKETAPYRHNPLPDVLYFALDLR